MNKKLQNSALPDGWKWVKLGDVCEKITKGGTPTTYGFKFQRSGVRFLKIENVKEGRVLIDSITDFISEEAHEYQKKSQLSVGDLLFSIAGTIGETCAVREEYLPANTNQAFAIIRGAQSHFNLKFLQFQLESFVAKIKIKARGGAMNNVSLEDLKNFESILPPKEEQLAIVSKIEELLSELDKGKQQLETAQQQLKIYRQAVLKWAFEGKLSELGRVGLKDDRIMDEAVKGEILQSANPKNPNSDNLPQGWRLVQINEIAEINPKLPNKDKISNKLEVQFLPMKLVEEIINRIHLTETRKYEEVLKGSYTPFTNGDVIFAKVTPCMENGKIAIVDNLKNGIGFGSSEFHVVRPRSDVSEKYLFYYLVQDRFRSEAANAMTGAVGLRRVPKQFIENHSIPLPSLNEQHFIVQQIESRLSVCDKVEETITTSLAQAETLRQSILKKAFEGKLV